MNNKKLEKDLLHFSIITFLTIIAWIAFDVYRILNTSTISPAVKMQTAQLNPDINTQILDHLSKRIWTENNQAYFNISANQQTDQNSSQSATQANTPLPSTSPPLP